MSPHLMCSATTMRGTPCQGLSRAGGTLCYAHLAQATLGFKPRRYRFRVCTATRMDGEPCTAWVAYTIPDADRHSVCAIHYYQHLRQLDRKLSEGCGCEATTRTRGRRHGA